MPGSPPPSLLGGSLGTVRHLSSGTTRLLRLPLLVTRLFVFLRVTLTSLPPFPFARFGYSEFLSRCAWALVGRFRPCSGSFAGEEVRRISQVPREPLSAFALLSDPGRISTPSQLRRFDAAPAVLTTKAPTSIIVSRLNHTALAFAPYASCRHLCRLRNVRYWSAASLCQMGFLPTGSLQRVSEFVFFRLHSRPHFLGFLTRQESRQIALRCKGPF